MRLFSVFRLAVLLALSTQLLPAQGGELPTQDLVFAIDNSGSMEGTPPSDPYRLRGVAACLILDGAELSSRVRAGLVLFDDRANTDGKLHDPDVIRQRLQADKLPRAQGNTNMRAALESAIHLLEGSAAEIKKIVLITDGVPDSGQGSADRKQIKAIGDVLAPRAARAGIEIFALGLSNQIDEVFLNEVTAQAGGRTLKSESHDMLLERAKELLGDRDNTFTIERTALPPTQMEYEFELPQGADRARLTAILERPDIFAPDELRLALSGPDSGDGGLSYQVFADGQTRVAAWSTFFSSAGTYKLKVAVDKPGFADHMGLQVFVEARSNLKVQILLSPPGIKRFTFGDQVKASLVVSSGGGQLPVDAYQASGIVDTGEGDLQISFSAGQATFKVPDVPSQHTIVVEVRTSGKLGLAKARESYRAVSPEPVILQTSRERIEFIDRLGPEKPMVGEAFKVFATFPDGSRKKRISISASLSPPPGLDGMSQIWAGATRLNTDGTREFPLPEGGVDLTLRLLIDPQRPFDVQPGGPYEGEVRLFSKDAVDDLIIPFSLEVRVPAFELQDGGSDFALWWDPARPRLIDLGRVGSDASVPSTFTLFLPEALYLPRQGPKIGDLEGRLEGAEEKEPEVGDGKLKYDFVDLPSAGSVDLAVLLTPTLDWEKRSATETELKVEMRSSMGMRIETSPRIWTLGGPYWTLPILGPFSLHGRHLATWLLVGTLFFLMLRRTWRALGRVIRFWSFRPGKKLALSQGLVVSGQPGLGCVAALSLPNAGSEIDDTHLGTVSWDPRDRQILQDATGRRLLVNGRPIQEGRTLNVSDVVSVPLPSRDGETLWEVEYYAWLGREGGGEIEFLSTPAPRVGDIGRTLVYGLAAAFAVKWLLGLEATARLAYQLPVERFYTGILAPFLVN